MSPLAEEGFSIHETLYPLIVDGKGRVKVKTNWHRTPLWPGNRVTARVWPYRATANWRRGTRAAMWKGHQILDLEHYLDVLEKKPGAIAGSFTAVARGGKMARMTG